MIELKNGYLFHMGYGLETKVPHALALFIEFMNEVVCVGFGRNLQTDH